MPELSRFFGIIIRMFVEVGGPHHRPHFHAYYQDQAAVFALDTVECLGGSLHRAHSGSSRHGTHPIHQVARFDIVGPYTLAVAFTDGTAQRINFRPVLHGAVFGPLQDLATFNAVTLDSEVGTLTWPNGADFDPTTLHDWSAVCDELIARAQTWADAARTQARTNTRMEPTRR